MIILIAFLSFSASVFCIEDKQWFKNAENVKVCCPLTAEVGKAVVLTGGTHRLQSMRLPPNSDHVMRIEADSKKFLDNNSGWSVDRLDKTENELCATKPEGSSFEQDNDILFICELVEHDGLGAVAERRDIRVKIYEPVKIVSQPAVVSTKQSGTAEMTCEASGFPNLKLTWRSRNTGQDLLMSNKTLINMPQQLTLVIPSVEATNDGDQFECVGSTDYPNEPDNSATGVTTLKVNVPPKISLDTNILYTDLGVQEEFNIYVSGSPSPELVCDGLHLGEPRRETGERSGERSVYRVTVPNVTQAHLNNFLCEALNDVGRDVASIRFTVSPSAPEILSPNETQHADYYMLKWRTKSRAPLKNVTLEIEEFPNSNGGAIVARSPRVRKITQPLVEPDQSLASVRTPAIDEADVSANTKQNPNRWQRIVWQHVANLSENTEHGISVQVCNQHDCVTSKLDSAHLRPSSIAFRTPKFNGTNKIKRDLLDQPPFKFAMLNQPGSIQGVSGGTGSLNINAISTVFLVLGIAWKL